jgi:hypothetical protein
MFAFVVSFFIYDHFAKDMANKIFEKHYKTFQVNQKVENTKKTELIFDE